MISQRFLLLAVLPLFLLLAACGGRSSTLTDTTTRSLEEDVWAVHVSESHGYRIQIPTFWSVRKGNLNTHFVQITSDTTPQAPLAMEIEVQPSRAEDVDAYLEKLDRTAANTETDYRPQLLSESTGPISGTDAVLRKEYNPATDSISVTAFTVRSGKAYAFRFHILEGLDTPYNLNEDEQQLLIELLSSIQLL